MDNSLPTSSKKIVGQVPSQDSQFSPELQHVTREMYIKNAELALTNKTLSILQKLNTIILSSVTDLHQVSQQIADVIVSEAEFKQVGIYIFKKNEGLYRVAASNGEAIKRAEYLVKRQFPSQKISLQATENLLIKALNKQGLQIGDSYFNLLTPEFTAEEASIIQKTLNVKSIFIYPLIVREEIIGVLFFSMIEDATELSEHEQDLINRLVGVIGIALDNSLLYERIQEANEKLKEVDKLKDEFVSLASHELRTPMSIIKSYAWVLLQNKIGVLNEKQNTYLSRIASTTDRLINLVNDMLNVSRIESGRFTIEPAKVDIGKLVSDVVTEMQSRAQEFGVALVYKGTEGLPQVKADMERTKQVLINLIGNSFKFTPKTGTIAVEVVVIDGGFVRVSVIDNGRGISATDLQRLFQKFNMVGKTHLTKQAGQGTGLGLYLSKSLIELQGGRIWASSPGEGKGSVFSFTLPIWIEVPPQVVDGAVGGGGVPVGVPVPPFSK
jgi:signal transduction histidine kinase